MHHFGEWLQATPLSVTIQSVTWVIPLAQSIHIVMIGVVFVSSVMISLRVLGRARADEPAAAVWCRFAPWMWGGLIVMAVTGATLIIGEPVREFTALSFWIKMILLVIAVATSLFLGRSLRPAARAEADGSVAVSATRFSAASKTLAIASVVIWLALIFLGRAIAYDVEVWGRLSLHS